MPDSVSETVAGLGSPVLSSPVWDSPESVLLPLTDDRQPQRLISSEKVFDGAVWNVKRESFEYEGATITRELIDHPGAVAVLALDDDGRVLLIKQYRHPIAARDWELPAGLLDIAGESPLIGAQRELAEEADLQATTWHLLSEFFTTPGGSNEALRVYLARGLSATEAFARHDEEAHIELRWVPLEDAVQAVLTRQVTNSILQIAVLTALAARVQGWTTLGDPNAAWPWHPKLHQN
ncbi:MAG: NUDIX hydrolase [Microbacteriaceae bacterium]|nr:NUDIX hydrolase [Microbacteriaceae bacterium]